MIGEDLILSKLIDALTSWYTKKKAKKEIVKEILLSLKIAVNNIILHMDLSKEFGFLMIKKFKFYLPNDIEYINTVLLKYQSYLDNELYDSIIGFLRYLIDYNEFINSATLGTGKELDEREEKVRTWTREIIEVLDEFLREIE